MAKVKFIIPSVINRGNGEKLLDINAYNLADSFTKVDEIEDGFEARILVNGEVKPEINVYINGRNAKFTEDLITVLNDGDEISILPAVSGGSEDGYEDREFMDTCAYCPTGIHGMSSFPCYECKQYTCDDHVGAYCEKCDRGWCVEHVKTKGKCNDCGSICKS